MEFADIYLDFQWSVEFKYTGIRKDIREPVPSEWVGESIAKPM